VDIFSANSNIESHSTESPTDYSTPISLFGAVCESLTAASLGGFLISNLVNIRYLTGFTGSYARLFIPSADRHAPILFTDGRYQFQAASQAQDYGLDTLEIEVNASPKDLPQRLREIIASLGQPSLAVESTSISWSEYGELQNVFGGVVSVQAAPPWVEQLRAIKTAREIDEIRRAATIADLALATVVPFLSQGYTERQIAQRLENTMLEMGADGPSFETIVASGPRAAMPHARPTERRISKGDLVVIDFGAALHGYHSDCTRTYSIGKPSDSQLRALQAVTEAQEVGISLIKPSVSCAVIDESVRSVLKAYGLETYFSHGLGHGVGLEIHESPWLNGHSRDTLRPSMVVTVEPGVYLASAYGVRIEDSLVVTEGGCEVLTTAPKDWLVN
jgi:Xaa-Pro aminopeptidase